MKKRAGLSGVRLIVEGRAKRIPPDVYAKSKPVRNDFVLATPFEDGLLLRAPLQSQGTGLMGLLARWSRLPDTKDFELEAVGAFVWELCDGAHTTETIARKLREHFKMNRLEAETALAAFLETLSRRRLVTLAVPKKKR